MNRRSHWFGILLALVFCLTAFPGAQAAPAAQDDADAYIANAESAAPSVIARDATIMGWDEEGMPTVILREGSNGWTCYDDWPASPGNDPACYDAVFNAWNLALMAGEEPAGDGTGIAYMLAGGSDPSNTDPFAMEPAEGEEWISTPPHIMIITPAGFDAGDFASDPQQDAPYIMWDDTPYEHLMVPVVPIADELLAGMDEVTANTVRSSPAGVVLDATIMGYPEEEGGDMVVVQEGTNGWTCWPDGLASPGNDPACNDAMMEAFWSIGDTQNVERVGLSYMLQGGSDASNTDPNLAAPPEGEEWVYTPPHVMLVIPGGFDESHFTTDHMSGFPYVMFSETGYEHLMIPIADMPEMDHAGVQPADTEQMMAEALAQELNTFDLMIAGDWEGYDAVTHPDFYQIGPDGAYIERDAMLAGLMDEKLVVRAPELGEMRVEMITPDAYMVTYPLNFNGSYDGQDFSNPRTVASLWVHSDGEWQNIFLVEQIRTAPLVLGTEARIANAESAAPSAIARDATILGYDEEGMPTVVLREGTNGWTCYVDWPVSPGNDPSCLDAVFNAWNLAMMAGEEPEVGETGIAYMLQGGSDPSNTDPFAMEPAEGAEWISTPPHVMIVTPGGFSSSQFSAEPSQDAPYIMWDGTPYEHLMQPVLPMAEAVQIPTLADADAQEVLLAEQQLNYAADFLHDVDTANLMLADEYQEAASGDRQVKADKLAWIKSAIYMGQRAEFTDVNVKFEGDTATISFMATFTGIYDGEPYNGEPSPVTNVWVKRDGRWQMLKGG